MNNPPYDEKFMLRAIELGEQARLLSPPNPWVGCVLVKNNEIIGEGFTQPPGQAHAEVMALRSAQNSVEGATAYVTLEPCSHYGRTPPCAKALIEAKIAKVIVANGDPDPKVCGKGMTMLREAGIDVITDVCSQAAAQSLAPYFHHRRTRRAFCLVKTAMSIDGRAAAADYTSKWITSPEARRDSYRLRAESQAVLVGLQTALKDNPSLTVREINPMPLKQPLRVVIDTSGKLESPMNLFDVTEAPTLIATSEKCPKAKIEQWQALGVEVHVFPLNADNKIDIEALLEYLGSRDVIQVLVEGGPTLLGAIIKNELYDRIVTYVGPRILGDSGIPVFKDLSIETIEKAPKLRLTHVKQIGDCVRLDYEKAKT